MANQEHLDILKQGVETWNQWRKEHPKVRPDLSRTDLHEFYLNNMNLSEVHLDNSDLNKAELRGANLYRADLSETDLRGADLRGADLRQASLFGANLGEAYFHYDIEDPDRPAVNGVDLQEADLREADLRRAVLIATNLTRANLTNCEVYGIAAWDVELEGAIQNNLIITRSDQPTITVDNLKVAQFIYLLLNNAEIRDVIDTITSKAVLILGRFTPERKAVLDALREALRTHGYVPILFDFDKPTSRDLTETVSTLAHLARFIIVDLTDPSSAPHEVATVIPQTVVPVQPILSQEPLIVVI